MRNQNQWQLQQRRGVNSRRRFCFQDGQGEIDFLPLQPLFQLRLIGLAQGKFEFGKFLADLLHNFRQVIAQDDLRGADADLLARATAQFLRHGVYVVEKRLDKTIKFFSGRSENKRAALKKRQAERILELQNLGADGGLLNAVRNVAHCLTDPTVTGHVIEKFEVMDVHIGWVDAKTSFI